MSRDGQHVGHVDGLVLNYDTRDIESFIIRSGVFLTHDRFVSLELIDHISPDGDVSLTITAPEVEKLPEFTERDFVAATRDDLGTMPDAWTSMATGALPVYFGTGSDALGFRSTGMSNEAARRDSPGYESDSNLPSQDIVIDSGTNVIGSDGKKLGTVDEITYGPEGQLTGFIVRAGFLFHHDVTVPAELIESIGEDHVRLRVTEEKLEQQSSST
jgi:uncharacterized protein YrrD